MTISFVASSGIDASSSAKGTSSTTIPYVGVGAGRIALLFAVLKPSVTATFDTPSNGPWISLAQARGGVGTEGAADNSPTQTHAWYRELNGTETGNIVLTASNGPDNITTTLVVYETDALGWLAPIAVTGAEDVHGAGRDLITDAWSSPIGPGDMLVLSHAMDTDNAAAITLGSLSQNGLTMGTQTATSRRLNNSAGDSALFTTDAMVNSGTPSALPMTVGFTTTTLMSCGPSIVVRLREDTEPPETVVGLSTGAAHTLGTSSLSVTLGNSLSTAAANTNSISSQAPIPPPEPEDLLTAAFIIVTGVGDCVSKELVNTEGGLPKRIALAVPGAIAWDNCQCGQFAQTINSVSPSDTFPNTADVPMTRCGPPLLVVSVTVSLTRCVPSSLPNGDPPRVGDLLRSARILEEDRCSLRGNLTQCLYNLYRNEGITHYTIGPAVSVGPDGACVGVEVTYQFGISNDCCGGCYDC